MVTVGLWLNNVPVVDACSSSYKKLEKQLQRKLQMQFRHHSPSIGGHRQHGGVALFVPLCKANRKGTKTIHLNVRLMGKVHTLIIVLPLTSTKTSKWHKQKSEPRDNLPHTATLDSCFLFHCLAYTHKYCVIYTAHSQNSHSKIYNIFTSDCELVLAFGWKHYVNKVMKSKWMIQGGNDV